MNVNKEIKEEIQKLEDQFPKGGYIKTLGFKRGNYYIFSTNIFNLMDNKYISLIMATQFRFEFKGDLNYFSIPCECIDNEYNSQILVVILHAYITFINDDYLKADKLLTLEILYSCFDIIKRSIYKKLLIEYHKGDINNLHTESGLTKICTSRFYNNKVVGDLLVISEGLPVIDSDTGFRLTVGENGKIRNSLRFLLEYIDVAVLDLDFDLKLSSITYWDIVLKSINASGRKEFNKREIDSLIDMYRAILYRVSIGTNSDKSLKRKGINPSETLAKEKYDSTEVNITEVIKEKIKLAENNTVNKSKLNFTDVGFLINNSYVFSTNIFNFIDSGKIKVECFGDFKFNYDGDIEYFSIPKNIFLGCNILVIYLLLLNRFNNATESNQLKDKEFTYLVLKLCTHLTLNSIRKDLFFVSNRNILINFEAMETLVSLCESKFTSLDNGHASIFTVLFYKLPLNIPSTLVEDIQNMLSSLNISGINGNFNTSVSLKLFDEVVAASVKMLIFNHKLTKQQKKDLKTTIYRYRKDLKEWCESIDNSTSINKSSTFNT